MARRRVHERSHRTGVSAPGWRSPGEEGDETIALDQAVPGAREVRLASRLGAGAEARRLVGEALNSWSLGHCAETGELLVSELLGNAVRHTGAVAFGVRISRRRGWVRVEVSDTSRALPCLVPVVRDLDESGRGLFLVDELADRWGVDLLPHGKTTWFELRAPQPS